MVKELHPRDDLFEGTKMTFGEHLEELRGALFRSLLGIALGVMVGLYFARDVVVWVQSPLESALYNFQSDQAKKLLAKKFEGETPPEWTNTIVANKLIPELVYSEPGIFGSPPEIAGEGIPSAIVGFTDRDLKAGSERSLCQTWLAEGNTPADKRSSALRQILPAEQRATVARLAPRESFDPTDRTALLRALNALLGSKELSALPEFSDPDWLASLPDAKTLGRMHERISAGKGNAGEVERLNRLLVAGHFRQQLEQPVLHLKPMVVWKEAKFVTQSLSPHEPFMIWMKAALVIGLFVSSPYTFLQVWNFVASGLYPHEKRYVHLYLPMSLGLFLAGAALAFFAVFPPVLQFLFDFNAKMNIAPETRINEWLSFVLILPLGFGISFQLPLVMLFLNRIGIFSVQSYLSSWRISILVIFIVSMVLTPADPISMLLMAGPLSILYFGGIGLCRWMPRSRNPFAEAYEPS